MHTLTNVPRAVMALALVLTPLMAEAKEHQIMMLNTAQDNAHHTNVFSPDILYIAPGDTVTFIPADAGHNTASKRGMIPDGAEPWNSPMDEEFSVTLTVPGLYGYLCLPHYEMGMVGLIVVGDAFNNIKAATKVRHPGSARAAFRKLLQGIETEPQD